jgi:hypothetical protein
MAIAPLENRLAGILPQAAPAAQPLTAAELEPMPAEDALPAEPVADFEPGTPNMQEGVQVAGPASAALRKLITGGAAKAERNLVPDAARAVEGELPTPVTEGRFKVIPEADQTLTDKVQKAVETRKVSGATQGKPGGEPNEPFNLSRYQTDDAAAIVGGVADALNIKTKSVTFDEIKAKAAESGISESFLARLVGNDGKMMANAVETYKALEVLESSAKELDRLFKMVDTGNATDIDKLKLRQQIAFHGLIQKGVKGMQSETARALAVFRIPRDGSAAVVRQMLDEYGGDDSIQSLAKSYMTLQTRAAKNSLVEKSMMSGVKDIWFSTYINGLLSSPVTHAKNIVGNAAFGLYQIPERMVASLYSNYLPKAAREGELPKGLRWFGDLVPGSAEEKVGLDEALTMVQSLQNGMTEGLQLAATAFRNNQPNDLVSKIELQRGGRQDIGASLQDLAGQGPDTWLGKGLQYYGTAVTLPGRALLTEDEFFKGVFYRMEINTQITRRAKTVYRESVEAGMSEADALAKAESEAADLLANPPTDLDEKAMQFAQKGTFTSELPPTLKSLQKVFNYPILKVVVPFFKTPANIGLAVVERTPFAPLSSQWREDIAKGGVYRDMALAKFTMGSGILATYAAYAAEGRVTGSGPSRKADREALLRTGWQPYSIKVGDSWVTYSGLEPVSAMLAIAADYAEYAQREEDDAKIEEVFLGMTYGLAEYMKSQPYLQGVADVASLLGFGKGSEGSANMKSTIDGLAKEAGGFVIGGSPAGAYGSLIAAIERLSNPTASDTRAGGADLPMGVRGFVEAFNQYKSRLPYFNESLPEQLNLWGDPVLRGTGAAYELILPTRVTKDNFSEVDDMLVRMGSPVGMPDRKIRGIEMDSVQYNRLLTIYGKELSAKDALLSVMTGPGFDMLSLDDQQKITQRIHSQYMELARNQLLTEFPELGLKIGDLDEARKAQGLYYKPD